jgi:hypothetical protein
MESSQRTPKNGSIGQISDKSKPDASQSTSNNSVQAVKKVEQRRQFFSLIGDIPESIKPGKILN